MNFLVLENREELLIVSRRGLLELKRGERYQAARDAQDLKKKLNPDLLGESTDALHPHLDSEPEGYEDESSDDS
eukprot:3620286-Amphidinium_carterae.1